MPGGTLVLRKLGDCHQDKVTVPKLRQIVDEFRVLDRLDEILRIDVQC
jgi:hypothetical protein